MSGVTRVSAVLDDGPAAAQLFAPAGFRATGFGPLAAAAERAALGLSSRRVELDL